MSTIPQHRSRTHHSISRADPVPSFVYGGRANLDHFYRELSDEQKQADIAFDSVFVLSLPGFVWFKADYPSTHPRYLHTCNVIGNRQMVSIGGKNPQDWAGRITRDPLPQGLGIFDLTEMKWTDGFDPTAAPYKTPDVVKNWYNNKYGCEAIRSCR